MGHLEDDWQIALRVVIKEFKGRQPLWGVFDCCQFVARYVEELTGVNHAETFPYGSKIEAIKLIREHNGIEGLISECLEKQPMAPEEIHAGDLVMCILNIDHDRSAAVPGVTTGDYVFAMHPDYGISRAPLTSIVAGWSWRS